MEKRGGSGLMVRNTKWVATAASVWIQCAVGASYTFGIYSAALKSSQGYDQSTLDTVSVFKDIGANAGVLSGLLYSFVAGGGGDRGRRRTWIVMVAGAAQGFVGYFFLWAAVAGVIARPPVAAVCASMFLAAHAQTFYNTANVVVGVQNFSGYGGTIVGILKGFLGLSGAILVQVYNTVCKGNPTAFLLMLAFTPTLITLFLMFLVRVHDNHSTAAAANHEKRYLNALSIVAVAAAAYLTALTLLGNASALSTAALAVALTLLLLLLLAPPLAIAVAAGGGGGAQEDDDESARLLPPDTTTSRGEDMDIVQAMRSVEFWLLFAAMVCALGSGMATINNMNQLGQSLGYTSAEITSLVSLWSVWNFLGRFGAGFLSDILLRSRGWPRPVLSAIALGTMSIGHVLIASGFSGNLYVGSVLVGVCYGSQWSLMPTITSEIFGVRHMGTIFNTIAVASPVGSYIFSVRVIGYIYDREAQGNLCFGKQCFMLSFFIMAGVACFGCLVAVVLFFRTRRFYQLVVLGRLNKLSS